ncbi:MAG: MFS transporter [Gammaproteobacteria bacterium]|nr:MFS transporter [Gammaproteobacteria bacterium]
MKNRQEKITVLGFVIWSLAALFFLYEFFLRTFVGTVAHQIIPDLHLNAETFSLLGTAYFLSYGIMQIPVGILCDKFGVKKIMIFATLICALATFLFAHSTGFATAFVGRLFMGFGSSFAFIALLVVALIWFPHRYFGFFAGASQFIGTMGPLLAAGPLMTMITSLHETWRTALSSIGMFGVVLAILILFIVRNKPKNATGDMQYLLRPEAIKPQLQRLLGNRQAWSIALYSAVVYVSIFLLAGVWGPDYLQLRGLSQTAAAYILSVAWIGYAVGCPLFGALSDVMRKRKPPLILCAIIGIVATLVIIFWQSPNQFIYGTAFFLLGLAASGQSVGFAVISEHVDTRIKSTALGLNNAAITLFSAILPVLVGWLVDVSSGGLASNLTPQDFFLGFMSMPILYLVGLLISIFWIKETYCKPQKAVTKLLI